MELPLDSGEVQTPARIALVALERVCALTDRLDRIHVDRAIVSRFLYDAEVETEGTRQAAEYRESQAKVEAGRVLELDRQLTALHGVPHGCSIELAALMTSASALCDRLDELDAGAFAARRSRNAWFRARVP